MKGGEGLKIVTLICYNMRFLVTHPLGIQGNYIIALFRRIQMKCFFEVRQCVDCGILLCGYNSNLYIKL